MTDQKDGALGRKPGKGRPKAKNPLSYVVNIRLTITDGQRLDNLADSLNRDRAELARSILLEGLNKMQNDLNSKFTLLVRTKNQPDNREYDLFYAGYYLGNTNPDDIWPTGEQRDDGKYPDYDTQWYNGMGGCEFCMQKGVTLEELKEHVQAQND